VKLRASTRPLPQEVRDVLGDDPGLVSLAERVRAVGDEPRARRGQRAWLVSATAAVAATAAVLIVSVVPSGRTGLADRALAAIGSDRVLHAVVARSVGDDRTVELSTASAVLTQLTVASWFDEQTGRLHVIERRNGAPIADAITVSRAGARAGSLRLDPALALFLTGYRQALRQHALRSVGTGVVAGRQVRWLLLVDARPAGERVAVDAHSFLPVVIQQPDGTRWSVIRIESLPLARADMRAPRQRPPAPTQGTVLRQRPGSPSAATGLLGVPLLEPTSTPRGFRFLAIRLETLVSAYPRSSGHQPTRSSGVRVVYRSTSGLRVEVAEATRPLPAYGFSAGLTFGFDPVPAPGWLQETAVGSGWIGQLHAGGLYITITAPDPETIITVARSLRPRPR
jgi:hypothetical protein